MDENERKAAFAKALERSRLMLDEDACRETVAAETVTRVHRTDGYQSDWHAGMPRQEPVFNSFRMTDAVEARLMAEIDRRITAAVDAAVAEVEQTISEHRAACIKWIEASSQAIVRESKHRSEHELRISALLAEVEKMQRGLSDNAKIIDLPALPLRDRNRAG